MLAEDLLVTVGDWESPVTGAWPTSSANNPPVLLARQDGRLGSAHLRHAPQQTPGRNWTAGVSRRLSACRSIGGDGLNLPSPHLLRLREKLHVMLYRHIQDDRVAPSVVDVRLLRGLCLALCSAGSHRGHPRRESTRSPSEPGEAPRFKLEIDDGRGRSASNALRAARRDRGQVVGRHWDVCTRTRPPRARADARFRIGPVTLTGTGR
ncbi:hypothetical protein B0T18DRAFT_83822 [Schizothecium vesticola]|uniref:Uncharacterized protein n=1 Tax=Schizothecium vesticola TaxID=314040 RepID=A0AA40F6K0_9PEZI|nr:hypothetical protein B0T18DRAFT_83822 [Schizothecium vesticola]